MRRDRRGEIAGRVEAEAGAQRGERFAELRRVNADDFLERAIGLTETLVRVESPEKAAGRRDLDVWRRRGPLGDRRGRSSASPGFDVAATTRKWRPCGEANPAHMTPTGKGRRPA